MLYTQKEGNLGFPHVRLYYVSSNIYHNSISDFMVDKSFLTQKKCVYFGRIMVYTMWQYCTYTYLVTVTCGVLYQKQIAAIPLVRTYDKILKIIKLALRRYKLLILYIHFHLAILAQKHIYLSNRIQDYEKTYYQYYSFQLYLDGGYLRVR